MRAPRSLLLLRLRLAREQADSENKANNDQNFAVSSKANQHRITPFRAFKIPRYPDAIKLQPDAWLSRPARRWCSKSFQTRRAMNS
jgi:hypothetical protein